MSANNAEKTLEELGWRQCSIVTGANVPKLKRVIESYQKDDIFIVLPYSCAVVQMDFKKEPYIELFRVRRTEKEKKDLLFGKNPRSLQLKMQNGNESIWVEGCIHDRFFINHSYFSGLSPNESMGLKEKEQTTVKNWFAKRYIRNALPTAFNKKAKKALEVLRKHLKKPNDSLDNLLGVYITLDPQHDELSRLEDPYEVMAYFLVQEVARNDSHIIKIKEKFEAELKKCKGLLLSDVLLGSEADISLSEYRDLIRLDDYDFISHRDDHDSPVI